MLWRRTIRLIEVLPAGAAQSLRRHELEVVAGGAGVERLVAPGAGDESSGLSSRGVNADWAIAGAANSSPAIASNANAHHPTSTAMRCIGVAAIALRIPVAGDVRLHRPVRIRRARPDLVVAVRRQRHARGPALPVVAVLRLFPVWPLPGGAEVDRDIDLLHPEIAGPGRAAQRRAPGAGGELGAVRRIGDDRAHRHRFEDAEVLRSALSPGTIGLIATR